MAKFDYKYGGRLGSISAMDTCFLVWKKAKNNDDNIMTRSRCEEEKKKQGGYTATLVTCGWARAVLEKDIRASGQEPYALNAQKHQKSNSRKSVRWSAVPLPCLSRFCFELEEK